MKRITYLTLSLLMFGSAAAQTTPAPLPPPASGRTITVYTTAGGAQDIAKAFEEKTGVRVNIKSSKADKVLSDLANAEFRKDIDAVWLADIEAFQTLNADLWAKLPSSLKASAFMPQAMNYLPLSVRYRTLMVHRDRVKADTLPKNILDLPAQSALDGKIGWAVANPAFTDLIAGMLAQHGEEKTRAWLKGMLALHPHDYGNEISAIPEGIRSGDLDVGLSFNSWVMRVNPAGIRVTTYFFDNGDIGNLPVVSGAAVLSGSNGKNDALNFLAFLDDPATQLFLYTSSFDQPLNAGLLSPQGRGIVALDKMDALGKPLELQQWREKATKLLIDLDLL